MFTGITQHMIKDAIDRLSSNVQKPTYKIDDVVHEVCSGSEIKGRQVMFYFI
jgi:hypothetical protein